MGTISIWWHLILLPIPAMISRRITLLNISKTKMTSDEFCTALLKEKKVAVVPGAAFGESGEGFVRISYCYSVAHLSEALKRIGEFVEKHIG